MLNTCKTCLKEKDESCFSFASSGKKGASFRHKERKRKTQCKDCDAQYARNFRAKNKNYKGTGKNKKFTNKLLSSAISDRMTSAKSRSVKSNLPFDLDKEYLYELFNKQKGKCVYTNEPISLIKAQPDTLSLDKIDPSKGYIKGNVQWVCWAVNRAKGDLTEKVFLEMCRVITEKCND